MNSMDDWIEAKLMNAKKRSASDKVTSWARPRKKYFFLRVLTVTHGHIGQTFNALLSGISSSDMIVPIRAQKVFLFALLQMSPDETGIPARPQRYSIGLHTKSMRLNYSFRDAGSKKPLRKAIKRNKN